MKIAIVHDDLFQWGGAERVLLGISELFPQAPIYTSVFDISNFSLKERFGGKKIITSFLQKIPNWQSLYKTLLPFYPLAFEQFDFSEFDVVISQTTRFAKSIITGSETIHICYCHTPPRFLWNFSGEKVPTFLLPYISLLRLYDRMSAQRVNLFLAGSQNAKKRIKKVYCQDSQILHPFIDFEKYQDFEDWKGDYYLIIARLNSYKRIDLAVKVFSKLGKKLKIVGVGPQFKKLQKISGKNINFLGNLSDSSLISLIAGSEGLIITAEEDFGLTSLEAQALGKGVIAYGRGGALETVINYQTGILFPEQTEQSLEMALERFEQIKLNAKNCKLQASKFTKRHFQAKLQKIVTASQNMLP